MHRTSSSITTLFNGQRLLSRRGLTMSEGHCLAYNPRHITTPQPSYYFSNRWLSSASPTAAAAGTKFSTPSSSSSPSSWIFDHLGQIFLGAIGLIVASLVRSSYGTSNRNKIRDQVEAMAALDPLEMEQLRQANAHRITPTVFRQIHQHVAQTQFPSATPATEQQNEDGPSCTYLEFVDAVKRAMLSLPNVDGAATGDVNSNTMIPTIEVGHLLDRVVLAALQEDLQRQPTGTKPTLDADERRLLKFWLTAFSLSMDSSVTERIRVLYEVLSYHRFQHETSGDHLSVKHDDNDNDMMTTTTPAALRDEIGNNDAKAAQVSWVQVCKMVGYLQETCQLAPDTQVVPTPDRQYPIQQYHRGNPLELTPLVQDPIDLPAFAEILRSKSVCAWGECYHKAKQGV